MYGKSWSKPGTPRAPRPPPPARRRRRRRERREDGRERLVGLHVDHLLLRVAARLHLGIYRRGRRPDRQRAGALGERQLEELAQLGVREVLAVLAALHRRAGHEDARLDRASCMWNIAVREPPDLQVLVVAYSGVLGLELVDVLREVEAERPERSNSRLRSSLPSGGSLPGAAAASAGGCASSSVAASSTAPWLALLEARPRLEESYGALLPPPRPRPPLITRRKTHELSLEDQRSVSSISSKYPRYSSILTLVID